MVVINGHDTMEMLAKANCHFHAELVNAHDKCMKSVGKILQLLHQLSSIVIAIDCHLC